MNRLPKFPSARIRYLPADNERTLLRRETDIESMSSPLLHQLNRYWLGKRGERTLPAWPDIDPAEIPRLLPNLVVAAVEYDPLRFFFRLVGTQVAAFRGDSTGHYLDSVPWSMPATRLSVQQSYARVIESRAPLFAEIDIRDVEGTGRRVCGGIWPLAPAEGAPIDRCLAAEDFGDSAVHDLSSLATLWRDGIDL